MSTGEHNANGGNPETSILSQSNAIWHVYSKKKSHRKWEYCGLKLLISVDNPSYEVEKYFNIVQ